MYTHAIWQLQDVSLLYWWSWEDLADCRLYLLMVSIFPEEPFSFQGYTLIRAGYRKCWIQLYWSVYTITSKFFIRHIQVCCQLSRDLCYTIQGDITPKGLIDPIFGVKASTSSVSANVRGVFISNVTRDVNQRCSQIRTCITYHQLRPQTFLFVALPAWILTL